MPWVLERGSTHICCRPGLHSGSVGDMWQCDDCGTVWVIKLDDWSVMSVQRAWRRANRRDLRRLRKAQNNA